MKVFDLHCDTATELYKRNLPFENTETHLNAATLAGHEVTQCFAVFLNDTEENPRAMDFFEAVARRIEAELRRPGLTPVLTVEGAGVLATHPNWIDRITARGCRMAGLAWNGKNPLATGAVTDDKEGLSDLGKEAVKELTRRSVVLDVSHLSAAGTHDIFTLTDAPVAASHSNARSLCDHPRNLTDGQAKEIFRRGGLVGLNLYPPFLGEGETEIKDILRHAEHFLALGGEKGLALGCDFDGVDALPRGIRHFGDLPLLAEALERAFGAEICRNICYQNAERFFFGNGR